MAKKAYTWKEETKEYAGIKLAKNKSADGEYLLPGRATWEKPPDTKDNEVAVWTGFGWEIKPDYRKNTYYDTETGAQVKKLDIGETPKATWTTKKPPEFSEFAAGDWVFNTEKWLDEAVRAERDVRLAGTDWTQLLDAPITKEKQAEFAVYRQQLRDLPATITFENPEFPKEPKV